MVSACDPVREPRQLLDSLRVDPRHHLPFTAPGAHLGDRDQVVADDLVDVPADQVARYVGEAIDPRADLAQLRGRFQDRHLDAAAHEGNGGGEPAHARSYNADVKWFGGHDIVRCGVILLGSAQAYALEKGPINSTRAFGERAVL